MHDEGYEVRTAVDDRNDAVFATRAFAADETVMVGLLLEDVTENDSHATQVAADRWARHDGLGPIVAPYLRALDNQAKQMRSVELPAQTRSKLAVTRTDGCVALDRRVWWPRSVEGCVGGVRDGGNDECSRER